MISIIRKIEKVIETIKIMVRRKYIIKTSKSRRKKINIDNFTIISNNCWGGFVYQSYNLKYNTPTLGMFFMARDYIKFISNLNHYMKIDNFIEVKPEESKWYNEIKDKDNFGTYPIARLGDIELHLLHYKSLKEAEDKWNIRKKRINTKRIIHKFSEMNAFKENDLLEFQDLKLDNKICFISNRYEKYKNDYTYVVSQNNNGVKASQEPVGNSKIVNINEFINDIK